MTEKEFAEQYGTRGAILREDSVEMVFWMALYKSRGESLLRMSRDFLTLQNHSFVSGCQSFQKAVATIVKAAAPAKSEPAVSL